VGQNALFIVYLFVNLPLSFAHAHFQRHSQHTSFSTYPLIFTVAIQRNLCTWFLLRGLLLYLKKTDKELWALRKIEKFNGEEL
jgi:hypothetical protein